ncbi:MAG: SUMF1/EgtB/PvdO family nonheme iron enzyme [Planctomycetales bacterium]|nr:SUMF1/EgtB/PvdO family nonheme iron enzyme [Planctomycetales bacterium]
MKPAHPPDEENRDPFEALAEEFAELIRNGAEPSIDNYLQRYPDLADQIEDLFPLIQQFEQPKLDTSLSAAGNNDSNPNRGKRTDDHAGKTKTYTDLDSSDAASRDSNSSRSDDSQVTDIKTVGRYEIKRLLGFGGFGRVYLAFDSELQRSVAIKMPSDAVHDKIDANEFNREARIVAQLEHPSIVPVYDIGEDNGRVYIVSRYIRGKNLSDEIAERPLTRHEAARVVELIAEGLHYAHSKGLVHRDIKPANILLDEQGTPFLTDFGIALTDQDVAESVKHAGTPRYMSPEQARGEGHLIDGRSDIFSLGIVLHELLTGVTPFRGKTIRDVLKRIISARAKPLRQYDSTIPVELERICLRALARHPSDRYSTAFDFAEDLRAYIAESNPVDGATYANRGTGTVGLTDTNSTSAALPAVVPKGLIAFDQNDADFFFQLLPGPFDRMGIPDSVRFWKHLIECREPEQAVRIGAVYGPSGCGKSSLIRAGVLPRLDSSVETLTINATADLAHRLLDSVERRWPKLKPNGGVGTSPEERLVDACLRLRRDIAPESGQKITLVIDQFEQYLHSTTETDSLADALRHCDGVNLQAIVVVRVDYWLGLSRFMQQLEPRQLDATNSRMVDLFDVRHARTVLKNFGRAYDALPSSELSESQNQFLDQAIEQLQTDDKVVAVRLSLFAEMMKDRVWEPATLRDLGGVEGIGVQFLEESLGDHSTRPEVKQHRTAIRSVLQRLLPDDFSELKGELRTGHELQIAGNYGERPDDFETVRRLLDTDLRLITPVVELDEQNTEPNDVSGAKFQLSHDFLVPAIREWLTLHQQSTPAGRARLKLEECTKLWLRRPTDAMLPDLATYMSIRTRVPKRVWTPDEQKLMHTATHRHIRRCSAWAASIGFCVAAVMIAGRIARQREAEHLTTTYLNSSVANFPATLEKLTPHLSRARAALEAVEAPTNRSDSQQRARHLRAGVALLQVDSKRADVIADYMIDTSDWTEFTILDEYMLPHKSVLVDSAWTTLGDASAPDLSRLNAATIVGRHDDSENLLARFRDVADSLATPLIYRSLERNRTESLSPVGELLAPGLWQFALNEENDDQLRRQAVALVLDYSSTANDIKFLVQARREHLRMMTDHIVLDREHALSVIRERLPTLQDARAIAIARSAAFRLGGFTLATATFDVGDDPLERNFFISFLREIPVNASELIASIKHEKNPVRLLGLVLAVADSKGHLSDDDRKVAIELTKRILLNHKDSGVHGACAYLLNTWQVDGWKDDVAALATSDPPIEAGSWFVNSQGQTFSVISAGTFEQGSSPDDPYYLHPAEALHPVTMNRTFAISTTPVTFEQFDRCRSIKNSPIEHDRNDAEGGPACKISWFDAAAYCNWLTLQDGMTEDDLCYEPNIKGEYGPEMKFAEKHRLKRGYRLPTQSEWEFACRAGAPPIRNRYYGTSDELLGEYAWCETYDKPQPVGMLKPNAIGLFDMLGNVHEWTATHRGKRGGRHILNLDPMVMRGGSFQTDKKYVRDACMYFEDARTHGFSCGFRIVRTLKAESDSENSATLGD